jgi:hypothetical protein
VKKELAKQQKIVQRCNPLLMQNGFHSLVLFPWLVNDAAMKKIDDESCSRVSYTVPGAKMDFLLQTY